MTYYIVHANKNGLKVEPCQSRDEVMARCLFLFELYDNDPTFDGVYLFIGSMEKVEFPPK